MTEETIAATIGGAEEVRDPLEGLVEKTGLDPGAPFAPEVLERLEALKQEDRAAFETLRAKLKKAGCRMTALNEALAGDGGGEPTQADILVGIAEDAELFHTPDRTCFADVDVDGHRETWAIRVSGFKHWLTGRYYAQTDGAPSSEALQAALNVIEAKARFGAPEREVHVRVGGLDGKIFLDLCDEAWRAVEIDSEGWRVIDTPPVRFRRSSGMLPLPVPVAGGSIEELRTFINVKNDSDFILVVAWSLAALRDRGPYPVLGVHGEQGTAKSMLAWLLRMLLDPNTSPTRALPRDDRDLFVTAANSRVLPFDNISALAEWISDTLCRLSTGGGFATRQLYTDQDEALFTATRPIILNGIEEIVNRPDLADRTVFLMLEPIAGDKRRLETELKAAFEAARPRILGALLNAVAMGLKGLPEIRLKKLPRMADFAIWATACETGLRKEDGTFWEAGTFARAYEGNIDEAVEAVLAADLVATAVQAFMETRKEWGPGTATDLLELLGKVAGEKATKAKAWPSDATRLGGRLRRAATFLRTAGIEVSIGNRLKHRRDITITNLAPAEPNSSRDAGDAGDAYSPVQSGLNRESALPGDAGGDADLPRASSASPPASPGPDRSARLSDGHIRELAGNYLDEATAALEGTGDVDRTALEGRLREKLAAEGVLPEGVEAELARIMATLTAF